MFGCQCDCYHKIKVVWRFIHKSGFPVVSKATWEWFIKFQTLNIMANICITTVLSFVPLTQRAKWMQNKMWLLSCVVQSENKPDLKGAEGGERMDFLFPWVILTSRCPPIHSDLLTWGLHLFSTRDKWPDKTFDYLWSKEKEWSPLQLTRSRALYLCGLFSALGFGKEWKITTCLHTKRGWLNKSWIRKKQSHLFLSVVYYCWVTYYRCGILSK